MGVGVDEARQDGVPGRVDPAEAVRYDRVGGPAGPHDALAVDEHRGAVGWRAAATVDEPPAGERDSRHVLAPVPPDGTATPSRMRLPTACAATRSVALKWAIGSARNSFAGQNWVPS